MAADTVKQLSAGGLRRNPREMKVVGISFSNLQIKEK